MDSKRDPDFIISRKQSYIPSQKQEIKILKMNSQELYEFIEEQLETNPVLELFEPDTYEEDAITSAMEQEGWAEPADDEENLHEAEDESLEDIDDLPLNNSPVKLSLKEHLQFQLYGLNLNGKYNSIGEYIIDNIDENGYLTIDTPEIAEYFQVSTDEVGRILTRIQSFDPPGICARNLKECLLIQLNQTKNVDDNVKKIIEYYLNDLASNRVTIVAKSMGIDTYKVIEMFSFIKTLEPKPGREYYSNDTIKYMLPDIIVKKNRNRFEVHINDDSVPAVCISPYYLKIAAQDVSSETKYFIHKKIESARLLIKCIEKRNNILETIAGCIISKQADFFEKGKRYLKVLTMNDIVKETNLNAAVVNTAVHGKYLQCAWGIYELKYFLSQKYSENIYGRLSVEGIKWKIENLIRSENKRAPYSDGKIAELLEHEGIKVSRWMVCKHRNEMGIVNSLKRKMR